MASKWTGLSETRLSLHPCQQDIDRRCAPSARQLLTQQNSALVVQKLARTDEILALSRSGPTTEIRAPTSEGVLVFVMKDVNCATTIMNIMAVPVPYARFCISALFAKVVIRVCNVKKTNLQQIDCRIPQVLPRPR